MTNTETRAWSCFWLSTRITHCFSHPRPLSWHPSPFCPKKFALLKLSCVYPRDNDGYYWLTGRVDDVINVRYLTLSHFLVLTSFFYVESCPWEDWPLPCYVTQTTQNHVLQRAWPKATWFWDEPKAKPRQSWLDWRFFPVDITCILKAKVILLTYLTADLNLDWTWNAPTWIEHKPEITEPRPTLSHPFSRFNWYVST